MVEKQQYQRRPRAADGKEGVISIEASMFPGEKKWKGGFKISKWKNES